MKGFITVSARSAETSRTSAFKTVIIATDLIGVIESVGSSCRLTLKTTYTDENGNGINTSYLVNASATEVQSLMETSLT